MPKETNGKKTVSFRLRTEQVEALDSLAKAQARDRTFLLNEAVDAYLNGQRWQIEHIKEGLRQADAGMGAAHAEVLARWHLAVLKRGASPYHA